MDLLDRMLRHDSWTTEQLLMVAATLNDDQLDRWHHVGHRTIRDTFDHMIWNIECWTDLMRGVDVRTRPASPASISELSARLQDGSRELHALARELFDQGRENETFVDHLDSPPREKSFAATILHLATHGMHHRSQLLWMLRRTGLNDLPEGDALSWEAATKGSADASESDGGG